MTRAHGSLLLVLLATAACGSHGNGGGKDATPPADGPRNDAVSSPDTRAAADAALGAETGAEASTPDKAGDQIADQSLPAGDVGRDIAAELDTPAADAKAAEGGIDGRPVDVGGDQAADAAIDQTPIRIDGPLGELCSGDSPRMVVNGVALTPDISGYRMLMDCCDGVQLTLKSGELTFPIGFTWTAFAGLPSETTVDLSNPPSGWNISVAAGCKVTSSSCTGATEYYRQGLWGWLRVGRNATRFDTGVCVHVEETAAEPHTMLHSLDLYVPSFVAN